MGPENLITIVYMGDSITEGQYVSPPHRWVDIITDRLTRTFLQSGYVLRFVVSGISGETTRQGLERFPDSVQRHLPDIVTIQFGLNDGNCWASDWGAPRVSKKAFEANLAEMITRCKLFGAQEVILSTNHATLRHEILVSGETIELQRLEYNDIVRSVASSQGVVLNDIAILFEGLEASELEASLLPYPDLLHLSECGHQRYAEVLYKYLEGAIGRVIEKRLKASR